jgi:hypothetical protein
MTISEILALCDSRPSKVVKDHDHNLAQDDQNGFMAKEDKTKLDTVNINELLWMGSNKIVSSSEPIDTEGNDGDIWFTYEI